MDIYDLLQRGALAHQGIDNVGTYNAMIKKIDEDEVSVNEMKIILSSLYKALNQDMEMRINLLKKDISESGVDEIEETYGLDDYSMAMIISEEMS